jgi:hypothetical protein
MRAYPTSVHQFNRQQKPRPLTDEQIRQFLSRGFLVLNSSLPREFHDRVFEQSRSLDHGHGHFGNNLLPLIPELSEVFEDSVTRGALTSVLGEQYVMHAHRAMHMNPPGSEQQAFHKDSYWGYVRRVRNHRPWWVMIMYFPQDTALSKGPTSVMEGSQHLFQRPEAQCKEVPVTGKAGTFVLIHYDLWHRKMKNSTDLDRYMFKFQFTRLVAPEAQPAGRWRMPKLRPELDLSPVWRANWNWLHGRDNDLQQRGSLDHWLGLLDADVESQGIIAGYEASAFGQQAVPALLEVLETNDAPTDNTRRYSDDGQQWRMDSAIRNATHGLVNIGSEAVPGLLTKLRQGNTRARKHAAFALGEIPLTSRSMENALGDALQDDDIHVRIAATEALSLKPPGKSVKKSLLTAMTDSKSEVRFDATLGLVRLAAQATGGRMSDAVAPLGEALYDSNRYVSAHAADALERIGSKDALQLLLPFLRTARWCAHTDNDRRF